MNIEEEIVINKIEIRHHFDEKSREYYFSIVDVIDTLGISTDPRNYWKVLKNRLKKGDNKLVTECNQLKMKSGDGKYYLTDVANRSMMLKIVEIVAPEKVVELGQFFDNIERENDPNKDESGYYENKLSTVLFEEGEIQVDMYQQGDNIFVKGMIAGVNPEDIFISLNSKILTLKINRTRYNNVDENFYNYQELHYGKFSRAIELPYEVDIDKVETNSSYGLLSIKLSILDKTRTKIIKVK